MAVILEEKRRFPRVRLHSAIKYQLRGKPEFDHTLSYDISAGGVSLASDRYISPSTLVMLEINLLSRILRPVGRIIRSQPLPHSDRYRLGVEFLEFDSWEKNYLAYYIDIMMQTSKL